MSERAPWGLVGEAVPQRASAPGSPGDAAPTMSEPRTTTPLWVPTAATPRPPVQQRPEFLPPQSQALPRPIPPAARPPQSVQGWVPPRPAPSRGVAPVLVGIAALGLALLLTVGVTAVVLRTAVDRMVSGAQPSAAGRSAPYEPRTRPAPTPSAVPPSAVTKPTVNPLYAQTLSGTSTRPKSDKTWAAVQESIRTQAECLDRMWQPVVEASGKRWSQPVLLFYSDPITRSPCGPSPDKEKAPAHYCPGNRTVYVSDAITDAVVRYRMLGFEVIAHEYTHHVQELMGILDQAVQGGKDDLATRRVELQAHCVAYASMVGMAGLEMTSRELDQLRQSWKYAGDPEGHGSAEAQQYWGERGVSATTLGACDTFSAPEDLVT